MKVSFASTLSLAGVKEKLNTVPGVTCVNFAHYPVEEPLCDIIREYSKTWTNVSFHACTTLNDRLVASLLYHFRHNLVSLDLSSCKLTDKSTAAICHSLHSMTLQTLKIGASGITNHGIIELSQECPQLKELHLAGCSQITDDAIINSLITKSQNNYAPFTVLMLSACKNITNSSIEHLAESQGEYLQRVSLSFCYHITDSAVIKLATYATKLEMLNLCGCKILGDSSAIAILKNCHHLTSLSMNSCKRLSPNTLEYLKRNIKSLKIHYFDLRSCPLIEKDTERTKELTGSILEQVDMHLKVYK